MASKHLFKTKITANDSSQKEELGAIRREWTDGGYKTYRYIRASMAGTTAATNGVVFVCQYNHGLGCTMVTNDISSSKANLPAGVAVGALIHDYYGWIQIGGYHPAVDTDGGDDLVKGDFAIVHASTDGVVDRTAAGTAAVSKPVGICIEDDDDTNNVVALLLTCTFGDVVQ